MTRWRLYDYVDNRGINDIESWSRTLEKPDRARLSAKLRMLEIAGPELPPQLLAGPVKGHIYKLRINGRVALRLFLCKGPINNDEEFTLLKGAIEKDRKLEPRNAVDIAETRRREIENDSSQRRCDHVTID